MTLTERLEGLTRAAARHPRRTIAAVLLLALAGGLLALQLRPSAGIDTFVGNGSASFRATAEDQRQFGSDAIVVMIREPLTDLVETRDLATLTQLEACLAGQVVVPNATLGSFVPAPAGTRPPAGGRSSPCGELMRTRPAKVVYGPGTFLNRAVSAVSGQIHALLSRVRQQIALREQQAYDLALGEHLSQAQARQAAAAAGQVAQQQQVQQLEQVYLNSGLKGMPRIDDPQFIPQVVFDQTRGVNQPKARFAYLFPTASSALIAVRLRPGLSDAAQAHAIALVRAAVRMPQFRLAYGGTYTVTGAPVVLDDLASEITGSIALLLLAAIGVMAVALRLVFRRPPRLLPLLSALCATGITFGLMAVAGAPLTLASVAVLPVLIGLGVDYAIQFGSRLSEREAAAGLGGATGGPGPPGPPGAAPGLGLGALGCAALATAAGFLVLLVSPVPMVRGFGLLLVVGILVALPCALALGSAAAALMRPGSGALRVGTVRASVRGAGEILAGLWHAAGTALAGAVPAELRARVRARAGGRRAGGRPASGWPRAAAGALELVLRRPGRVLLLGTLLAAIGWVADTGSPVQSDVTKLVPAGMPALRDLHTLERTTGVSGEIDVLVRGRDVTDPQIVAWMTSYESALLSRYGYLESRGCAAATLCPALSLPDLFSAGAGTGATHGSAAGSGGSTLTGAQIRALLAAVPTYFSQAVIAPDHHEATLAFGIRLMPLARQQAVIDTMRSRLRPPAGATASLAGLPVLAAQADAALASPSHRLLSTLLGLIAVSLVLLVLLRSPRRALVPMAPIVLATGWSSLILFVIGIPLNPMSATLGTLVIAISTEFSVLLSERFRAERAAAPSLEHALRRTMSSTGTAVLASGLTAIAGFGVLVLSNITMLRDFGFVTVIDLAVSLAGVMLVLPAALAVDERGTVAERLARGRWGLPGRIRHGRAGVAES